MHGRPHTIAHARARSAHAQERIHTSTRSQLSSPESRARQPSPPSGGAQQRTCAPQLWTRVWRQVWRTGRKQIRRTFGTKYGPARPLARSCIAEFTALQSASELVARIGRMATQVWQAARDDARTHPLTWRWKPVPLVAAPAHSLDKG
eukprot:354556-Chlamydomonas_euryale.AAC.1